MGGALTPQENFLYLLSELERAVGRGTIVWSLELSRLPSFDFQLPDMIHRATSPPPISDSKGD
jgi:hypothetical protein